MKSYLNVGPSPVTIPGKGTIEPGDTVEVDGNVATSFYGDPNWEEATTDNQPEAKAKAAQKKKPAVAAADSDRDEENE